MRDIAKLNENDKKALFHNTAAKMGMTDAIIEKDFWVCFMPKKEDTVTNYSEKMEMLRFALSQYNAPEYFENGIPESVIDAYVEKIVVFEDHFEWYLRFGGNDPLKCRVNGKKDANPEVIFGDSSSSLTELEKHRQLSRSRLKSNIISVRKSKSQVERLGFLIL